MYRKPVKRFNSQDLNIHIYLHMDIIELWHTTLKDKDFHCFFIIFINIVSIIVFDVHNTLHRNEYNCNFS